MARGRWAGVGAREAGVPLLGEPGPNNAISDVPGVEVGLLTLIEGSGTLAVGSGPVRTGATVILPRGRAGVGSACAAGTSVLNGNGEMTGAAFVEEAGLLDLPVVLTNSHAVGAAHRGVIDWVVANVPERAQRWMLPVVAETYDGYLNDINGAHVQPAAVARTIQEAAGGPVAQGSVGGGTGMCCYGFKGGTGSASRVVTFAGRGYVVGVLVQANFGTRDELVVAGVPVGRALPDPPPAPEGARPPAGAGSVIVVVATDAPLLPGQCKAMSRRVPLGLARTGTSGSHFSGDLFLTFSTANEGALHAGYPQDTRECLDEMSFVPWSFMDRFFEAVVQAVEEAVLNALFVNEDMTGRDGHAMSALPVERVIAMVRAGRSR
ncbi:P1 family peptidase [Micromonospora halotolerans]|uniref:P1 family peptidase n=1 Tax=Micromonospora halotolerans TaxID=709879 RepID=A0ABY9ZVV5_9ACTN|nr:P1 family peptidase [Micromonospora halotolerans]WNM39314.1 P1 family peptidase [Micromonospora halotolerans]